MTQHLPMDSLLTALNHPLYQLNEAIQRLEEEHVLLQEQLLEIYGMAKAIGANEDAINWIGALRDLHVRTAEFQGDLQRHAAWEETTMFPIVAWYFGEELDQFTVMEQEHEIAEQYLLAFMETVERLARPVERTEARELAGWLLQAYNLLHHHFGQEEQMIAALADRSNAYGY